jgi:hypothetical protein
MTWDPRKTAGEMCFVHDCQETRLLHGITRWCAAGHQVTLRYCSRHVDKMMVLALYGPGIVLCRECGALTAVVLEGEA